LQQVRGNILKVDRHKYVKIAYHGFHEIGAEDRKTMYNMHYQASTLLP
jgi:5'-nucleotidase